MLPVFTLMVWQGVASGVPACATRHSLCSALLFAHERPCCCTALQQVFATTATHVCFDDDAFALHQFNPVLFAGRSCMREVGGVWMV